ncbi:MAG: hypothetical protein F4X34_05365 [Chloroflexi bacterium]|nr:hypothetical protein [Chloroflexota bacterium]
MTQENELVTLDPRGSSTHEDTGIAPRPRSLDGLVIGLLSNNKPNSELLLRGVADLVKQQYEVKDVVEANKGSHRIPAPAEIISDLAERCDVVVTATAE